MNINLVHIYTYCYYCLHWKCLCGGLYTKETELSEWSETLGHLVKSTPWHISFASIDISAKYCLPFYFKKIENKWKKENLQIDYICDHGKLCAHQSESKGLYKMWWAVSLYFHLSLSVFTVILLPLGFKKISSLS